MITIQSLTFRLSQQFSSPNTANRTFTLEPGLYFAKHDGAATGNYEIYATDDEGNPVGEDLGTAGITIENGVAIIS